MTTVTTGTEAKLPDPSKIEAFPMQKISETFAKSISAIRSFNEKIGPLADNHDSTVMSGFIDSFFLAAGLDPKRVEEILKDDSHPEKAMLDAKLAECLNNREGRRKFFEAARTVASKPPAAGKLLRRGVLITVVSYLDVVISQLMRTYYKAFPQAVSSAEKSISLADLRDLGSIDAAMELIISREVDLILRDSLDGQLEHFTKFFKIDLGPLEVHRARLIETVQRRHLWVHNDGIINKYFLHRISKDLITEYQLKEGEEARLIDDYVRRAIDRVHLAGVVLIQQSWRKWFPTQRVNADRDINLPIYDAILEDRYKLAQNIGEYAKSLSFTQNELRLNVLLNLAQAYKWGNEFEKMHLLIDAEDWSTYSLRYRLVLNSLRGQTEEFFATLKLACLAQEITYEALVEWPIFKEMRMDSRFVEFTTTHFGNAQSIPPIAVEIKVEKEPPIPEGQNQ